jgi:hypothetical protein
MMTVRNPQGKLVSGTLSRDRLGLLRLTRHHRLIHTDYDLVWLITSGWEIIEATADERRHLETAGLTARVQ